MRDKIKQAARRKALGFVNIFIKGDVSPDSGYGYSLCCYDFRSDPDGSPVWARKTGDPQPIHKIKQAARRKACHLFRKAHGRNPEESEINWCIERLQFLPGDINPKQHKKLPKTLYVGRLRMWNGPDKLILTGPRKVTWDVRREQWVGTLQDREGVVGMGEIVSVKGYCTRFADPDKKAVEWWLQGIRAALISLGKTFEEDTD